MIQISNNGQKLLSTNYWTTEHARSGLFFGSWNAGALRLLVPNAQLPAVAEMRTGRICVVSRGKFKGHDSLELMWDDDSEDPYCVHLDMRQTDRVIPSEPAAIAVSAWGEAGLLGEWPGRYRVVSQLPYALPWVEH